MVNQALDIIESKEVKDKSEKEFTKELFDHLRNWEIFSILIFAMISIYTNMTKNGMFGLVQGCSIIISFSPVAIYLAYRNISSISITFKSLQTKYTGWKRVLAGILLSLFIINIPLILAVNITSFLKDDIEAECLSSQSE